jgi:hypothetical protein
MSIGDHAPRWLKRSYGRAMSKETTRWRIYRSGA